MITNRKLPFPDPRVCYVCDPPHYENCPQCFGLGFRLENGELIAVGAGKSDQEFESMPCLTCGGTKHGLSL